MVSLTGLLNLQYSCVIRKFEDNISNYISTDDGLLFDIDAFNNLILYHQILFYTNIKIYYIKYIKLKKQLKKIFNIVKKNLLNHVSILIYKKFYNETNNYLLTNDFEKIKSIQFDEKYKKLILIETNIYNYRL